MKKKSKNRNFKVHEIFLSFKDNNDKLEATVVYKTNSISSFENLVFLEIFSFLK